jgi:hypothetical protein
MREGAANGSSWGSPAPFPEVAAKQAMRGFLCCVALEAAPPAIRGADRVEAAGPERFAAPSANGHGAASLL